MSGVTGTAPGTASPVVNNNNNFRIITVGRRNENEKRDAVDNSIRTSKYTLVTFFPLALREQFRRFGNIFFFALGFIMLIGYYTPIYPTAASPWTIYGPLSIVIFLSLLQLAIADLARHRSDIRTNTHECIILTRNEKENSTEEGGSNSEYGAVETHSNKRGSSSSRKSKKPLNTKMLMKGHEIVINDIKRDYCGVRGEYFSTLGMASASFETVIRAKIFPGNIILVRNRETIPADMVLLASSCQDGAAYIETSSIDGETNLKVRSTTFANEIKLESLEEAVKRVVRMSCLGYPHGVSALENPIKGEQRKAERKISRSSKQSDRSSTKTSNSTFVQSVRNLFRHQPNPEDETQYIAMVKSERPNASVHTYAGVLTIPPLHPKLPCQEISLGAEHLLLRGAVLRNTEWALGVVVFTGSDTKLIRNTTETPSKFSRMDAFVNQIVLLVILVLIVIVFVCSRLATVRVGREMNDLWYLGYDTDPDRHWLYLQHLPPPKWERHPVFFIQNFFLFLTTFYNIIPLAMFVSIETLVIFFSYAITQDVQMYHEETNTPAIARGNNVTDLGQVKYIFSDKTGTLTQNIMKFKRCSVGGVIYGAPIVLRDDVQFEMSSNSCKSLSQLLSNENHHETKTITRKSSSSSSPIHSSILNQKPLTFDAEMFLRVMALCNTVVVEEDFDDSNSPEQGEEESNLAFAWNYFMNLLPDLNFSSTKDSDDSNKTNSQQLTHSHTNTISSKNTQRHKTKDLKKKNKDGAPFGFAYQAESPDEAALVEAASLQYGFQLVNRTPNFITMHRFSTSTSVLDKTHGYSTQLKTGQVNEQDLNYTESKESIRKRDRSSLIYSSSSSSSSSIPVVMKEDWTILGVNKFDSDRKRMSVLLRSPHHLGSIPILLCKGADSSMLNNETCRGFVEANFNNDNEEHYAGYNNDNTLSFLGDESFQSAHESQGNTYEINSINEELKLDCHDQEVLLRSKTMHMTHNDKNFDLEKQLSQKSTIINDDNSLASMVIKGSSFLSNYENEYNNSIRYNPKSDALTFFPSKFISDNTSELHNAQHSLYENTMLPFISIHKATNKLGSKISELCSVEENLTTTTNIDAGYDNMMTISNERENIYHQSEKTSFVNNDLGIINDSLPRIENYNKLNEQSNAQIPYERNTINTKESVASKHIKTILNLQSHLGEFAKEGLRTLVLGVRVLSEEECEKWIEQYNAACNAVEERSTLLTKAAKDIEQDLHIVGATAIEDKLQDGVPEAIANLAKADIKLWVCTGDKRETAIEIGYATKVLTPEMHLAQIINGPDVKNSLAEEFLHLVKIGKLPQYQRARIMEEENASFLSKTYLRSFILSLSIFLSSCVADFCSCFFFKCSKDDDDEGVKRDEEVVSKKAVRDFAEQVVEDHLLFNSGKRSLNNPPEVFERAKSAKLLLKSVASVSTQESFVIREETEDNAGILEKLFAVDEDMRNGKLRRHLKEKLGTIFHRNDNNQPQELGPRGLIIEGAALSHFLEKNKLFEEMLFAVASTCQAVIACRVSPKQKALLVKLVQSHARPSPVTLAIGDGANDCGMIQEAHVGIGISGREGQQAVNSSDFAIAQFKYLERLILVHGRLAVYRMSKLALYCFHKNAVLAGLLIIYQKECLYSGALLFDQWIVSLFNFCTMMHVNIQYLFDRDLDEDYILAHPQVYAPGPTREYFLRRTVLRWICITGVNVLIIYFVCGYSFHRGGTLTSAFTGLMYNQIDPGDGESDLTTVGTTMYTTLIVTLGYKLLLESRSIFIGEFPFCCLRSDSKQDTFIDRLPYTWVAIILLLYTFWTTAAYLYSLIPRTAFSHVAMHMYNMHSITWLLFFLVPITVIIIDLAGKLFSSLYFPTQTQIHAEIEREQEIANRNSKSGGKGQK